MTTISLDPGPAMPDLGLEGHADWGVDRAHTSLDPSMFIPLGSFTGLTPDMIILMVRRQVGQMDEQIKSSINAVENNRNEAAALGGEILRYQELKRMIEGHENMEDGGSIDLTEIDDHDDDPALRDFMGVSHEASEETATRAFVDALNDRYGLGIEPGATNMDMSVIDQKLDELKESQRTINSGTEMTMMQLQSAMQMRTQILQLGSNMLSAQDQANDTIIGNLR